MSIQFRSRIPSVVDYSPEIKSVGICCYSDTPGGTSIKVETTQYECSLLRGYFQFGKIDEISCDAPAELGCCCSCSEAKEHPNYDSFLDNLLPISDSCGIPTNRNQWGDGIGLKNNVTKCHCDKIGGNWTAGTCPSLFDDDPNHINGVVSRCYVNVDAPPPVTTKYFCTPSGNCGNCQVGIDCPTGQTLYNDQSICDAACPDPDRYYCSEGSCFSTNNPSAPFENRTLCEASCPRYQCDTTTGVCSVTFTDPSGSNSYGTLTSCEDACIINGLCCREFEATSGCSILDSCKAATNKTCIHGSGGSYTNPISQLTCTYTDSFKVGYATCTEYSSAEPTNECTDTVKGTCCGYGGGDPTDLSNCNPSVTEWNCYESGGANWTSTENNCDAFCGDLHQIYYWDCQESVMPWNYNCLQKYVSGSEKNLPIYFTNQPECKTVFGNNQDCLRYYCETADNQVQKIVTVVSGQYGWDTGSALLFEILSECDNTTEYFGKCCLNNGGCVVQKSSGAIMQTEQDCLYYSPLATWFDNPSTDHLTNLCHTSPKCVNSLIGKCCYETVVDRFCDDTLNSTQCDDLTIAGFPAPVFTHSTFCDDDDESCLPYEGRCCVGYTCLNNTTRVDCEDYSGTWTKLADCTGTPCGTDPDPYRACCQISTGDCNVKRISVCQGAGADYETTNFASCAPGVCAPPIITRGCCVGTSCGNITDTLVNITSICDASGGSVLPNACFAGACEIEGNCCVGCIQSTKTPTVCGSVGGVIQDANEPCCVECCRDRTADVPTCSTVFSIPGIPSSYRCANAYYGDVVSNCSDCTPWLWECDGYETCVRTSTGTYTTKTACEDDCITGVCCRDIGGCDVTNRGDCQSPDIFKDQFGVCNGEVTCPVYGSCCDLLYGICTTTTSGNCPVSFNQSFTPNLLCYGACAASSRACCKGGGNENCYDYLVAKCLSNGWTPSISTTCTFSPNNCVPPPTQNGACCDTSTGTCNWPITAAKCPNNGILQHHPGLECEEINCVAVPPTPTGSCCDTATRFCDTTFTESKCGGFPNEWTEDGDCDRCEIKGRFCVGTTCYYDTEANLNATPGSYDWAPGISDCDTYTCTPIPPDITGSCLRCRTTYSEANSCYGDGTSTSCAAGYELKSNMNCSEALGTCPLWRKCCFGDGSCYMSTQSVCVSAGGSWNTSPGTCTSPCPQPTGTCCLLGVCKNYYTESSCETDPDGPGNWKGDMICPNPTCVRTGSCCNTESGSCNPNVTELLCVGANYVFRNQIFNCDDCSSPLIDCCVNGSCEQQPFSRCASPGCGNCTPPEGYCCNIALGTCENNKTQEWCYNTYPGTSNWSIDNSVCSLCDPVDPPPEGCENPSHVNICLCCRNNPTHPCEVMGCTCCLSIETLEECYSRCEGEYLQTSEGQKSGEETGIGTVCGSWDRVCGRCHSTDVCPYGPSPLTSLTRCLMDVRIPRACCYIEYDPTLGPIGMRCENTCSSDECEHLKAVSDSLHPAVYTDSAICSTRQLMESGNPFQCVNPILPLTQNNKSTDKDLMFGTCWQLDSTVNYLCDLSTENKCKTKNNGYWVSLNDSEGQMCNSAYRPQSVNLSTSRILEPEAMNESDFLSLGLEFGDFYKGGYYIGIYSPGAPVTNIASSLFGSVNFTKPEVILSDSRGKGETNKKWVLLAEPYTSKTSLLNNTENSLLPSTKLSKFDGFYNCYGDKNKEFTGLKSSLMNMVVGRNRRGFPDFYLPSLYELMFMAHQIYDFTTDNYLKYVSTFKNDLGILHTTYLSSTSINENLLYTQYLQPNDSDNFGRVFASKLQTTNSIKFFRRIVLT